MLQSKMIQTLFGSVEQEPNLLDRLKSGVAKMRAGDCVCKWRDQLLGGIDHPYCHYVQADSIRAEADLLKAVRIYEEIKVCHSGRRHGRRLCSQGTGRARTEARGAHHPLSGYLGPLRTAAIVERLPCGQGYGRKHSDKSRGL